MRECVCLSILDCLSMCLSMCLSVCLSQYIVQDIGAECATVGHIPPFPCVRVSLSVSLCPCLALRPSLYPALFLSFSFFEALFPRASFSPFVCLSDFVFLWFFPSNTPQLIFTWDVVYFSDASLSLFVFLSLSRCRLSFFLSPSLSFYHFFPLSLPEPQLGWLGQV